MSVIILPGATSSHYYLCHYVEKCYYITLKYIFWIGKTNWIDQRRRLWHEIWFNNPVCNDPLNITVSMRNMCILNREYRDSIHIVIKFFNSGRVLMLIGCVMLLYYLKHRLNLVDVYINQETIYILLYLITLILVFSS